VAYVLTHLPQHVATSSLFPDDLRHFLRERLPEYMVPSAFVALETWPLTPHGKIDYPALPPPEQALLATRNAYVPPLTTMEQMLVRIWIDILGVERIGVNDNFFEIGGHSLVATQVISRVQDTFQVRLPLRCVFEKPTIRELALTISQSQGEQKNTEVDAISRTIWRDTNQVLANLNNLSDDEVDSLLDNLLAEEELGE